MDLRKNDTRPNAMMDLIFSNPVFDLTDKANNPGLSGHCYIAEYYDREFAPYRNTATNILEIGVCRGGSIALWTEYFKQAEIIAIDTEVWVTPEARPYLELPRVKWLIRNAYDLNLINSFPQFDIIIDDGPHNFESTIWTTQHLSHKLKEDGMLVIEDLQYPDRIPEIIAAVPPGFKYEVVDLRHINNKIDDLLFVIRRAK